MAGAPEESSPFVTVTAMVIESRPMGEYDRRIVLLTRERGKISCFARGARKPNSTLVGATDLFCFGTFRLYEGRSSYTLREAEISNYFPFFRTHIEEALYGQYFLEVLDFGTRENNDEAMLLLLAYQSLRALESPAIPNRLVRAVFEIKTVVLEGVYPGDPDPEKYLPATIHALQYIVSSDIAKLYSFTVTEEAQKELLSLSSRYMKQCFEGHAFQSLEVLTAMGY